MKQVYEKSKQKFYSKALLILAIVMLVLTATFLTLDYGLGSYQMQPLTHGINGVVTLLFILLWFIIRRSYVASFFVCPILTAFAFYYFAFVDYDGSTVSIYYSMIVGITSSYFILIIFNEAWLLSSAIYIPMLAFYMFKTGVVMVGSDITEFAIRTLFCIFLYLICAYKIESLTKQSFLGSQSQDQAFYRWLKIFETFPEGLALIRKGQIMYANRAIPEMFEYTDYSPAQDQYNEHLQKMLSHTEVTRLGNEADSYNCSAWDFLDMGENGAPFSFNLNADDVAEETPEMTKNADGSYTKYISMNKVMVNVAGNQDKLFIVRDLNSMVNLQKLMYMKRHL
jgi:PAS domain-containing protein